MKKDKKCNYCSIGGQALLEGIMMKSPKYMTMAVRRPDGKIQTRCERYTPLTKKNKFFSLPIVRGCVSFVESMATGMQTMNYAASVQGEIEEEPSKFEKWLSEKLGKSIEDIVVGVAMVLGILLAVGLFVLLPSFLAKLVCGASTSALLINLIEGLIRIAILVLYMWGITFIKDLRRLFMYHGAEHKTIATYEAGEALTVENVKKHSRLHPRCGTNYLFLVMAVSILFYAVVGFTGHWLVKTLLKIALLPVVAGVSYEVLKAAAKSDNLLCRIVRWPGMMLQHITTKEPDDDMMEIAITAFELALDPAGYYAEHPELVRDDEGHDAEWTDRIDPPSVKLPKETDAPAEPDGQPEKAEEAETEEKPAPSEAEKEQP